MRQRDITRWAMQRMTRWCNKSTGTKTNTKSVMVCMGILKLCMGISYASQAHFENCSVGDLNIFIL